MLAFLLAGLAETAAQTTSRPTVQLKGDKRLIDEFEKLNQEGLELSKQRNYEGALLVLEKCLKACEKELGPDDPYLGKILNNVGEIRRLKGDYPAAMELIQRSLRIREGFYGSNHAEVATSLNNLAFVFLAQGDASGALPIFRRTLALEEKLLGTNDSRVAGSLMNIAVVHRILGDLPEAILKPPIL